jgi:hypothetical protein
MKARLIFLLVQASLLAAFLGAAKGGPWSSWTDGH